MFNQQVIFLLLHCLIDNVEGNILKFRILLLTATTTSYPVWITNLKNVKTISANLDVLCEHQLPAAVYILVPFRRSRNFDFFLVCP